MNTTNTLSVFIVDDEELARERLKRLLEAFDNCHFLGEAENGEQALSLVAQCRPDIVLLDIRMPGEDGLSVAEKFSQLTEPPAIIFCTAYDEYAVSAFRYNAMGYLLKPVRKEDLQQALSNAQKLNQLQIRQARKLIDDPAGEQGRAFVANTWQGQELIPFEDIFYFKSDQKYLTVVHVQGETLSDQTLKELENSHPELLLRVHRNTLINKQHISKLSKDSSGHYEIHLTGCSHPVSVSRRHVSDIKDYLASLGGLKT
jgi:two-component system response regulator AlgR